MSRVQTNPCVPRFHTWLAAAAAQDGWAMSGAVVFQGKGWWRGLVYSKKMYIPGQLNRDDFNLLEAHGKETFP